MNKTIKYKGTKHKGNLKKKHSTQKILKKHNLSQDEKAIICSEYSRGYKSFEHDFFLSWSLQRYRNKSIIEGY